MVYSIFQNWDNTTIDIFVLIGLFILSFIFCYMVFKKTDIKILMIIFSILIVFGVFGNYLSFGYISIDLIILSIIVYMKILEMKN